MKRTKNKNQTEELDEDKKKKEKEILKFSFSSLICFGIDYCCYIIFLFLKKNLILSNIIARIISSIANFIINKKLVFKSTNKIKIEMLKYFSLVFLILSLNTIILKFLSQIINPYIAKFIVELILFIISFGIQNKYIFKGSEIYKK